MKLNLERIILELMMESHVSFYYNAMVDGEMQPVHLHAIYDYVEGITYTPRSQHVDWFKFAKAKLAGRTITFTTPRGVSGIMNADDWFFTHDIQFTIGEFQLKNASPHMKASSPMYRHIVRSMMESGVSFTRQGQQDGYQLSRANMEREILMASYLPLSQTKEWALLAVAKLCDVPVQWRGGLYDSWIAMAEADFHFPAPLEYRIIEETQDAVPEEVQPEGTLEETTFTQMTSATLDMHTLVHELVGELKELEQDIAVINRLTERGYTVTKNKGE